MALKVGELYGELKLENQKFNKGLHDSGKEMSDFAKATGRAAAIGTAAMTMGMELAGEAIHKVTEFLSESVNAYRADQVSRSKLTQSLKQNVDAWNGETEAMEKSIETRMKLGFSDDEQRQSLALLVAATHDVDKALEVQAVAMDLARFKGISLAEAGEALTKVEAGSYRILKSLGIVLGENATAEEALAAVKKVAHGQAAEYAKTDAGIEAAANVRIEESMERVGQKFSELQAKTRPALASMMEGILDFTNSGIEGWQMLIDKMNEGTIEVEVDGRKIRVAATEAQIAAYKSAAAWKKGLTDGAIGVEDGGQILAQKVRTAAEEAAKPIPQAWNEAWRKTEQIVDKSMHEVANVIRQGRKDVVDAMSGVIADTYDPIIAAAEHTATELEIVDAEKLASQKKWSEMSRAERSKLTEEEAKIAQEWTDLDRANAILRLAELRKTFAQQTAAMSQYGTDAERITALTGQAMNTALIDELNSGDTARKTAGMAAAGDIANELYKLESAAGTTGVRTGNVWVDKIIAGLEEKQQLLDEAAGNTMSPLSSVDTNEVADWGKNIGKAWTSGVASGITAEDYKIDGAISKAIGSKIIGFSPPKAGPLMKVDVGGENVAKAWLAGLTRTISKGTGLSAALLASGTTRPLLAGADLASSRNVPTLPSQASERAVQATQGVHYHYNLTVQGDLKAKDETSVLTTLRRMSAVGQTQGAG